MEAIPYWRLSGFYLFYFGSLGAFLPYWGLYLRSLQFNAQAIGELTAIIAATRIIAPNVWGWIADYTGRRVTLVRLTSLLAVLCFLGVFIDHSYRGLAITIGLFSFFWNAALPQFEAITLAYLGRQSYRYTHIRLWGSIGFILTVTSFGWLFEGVSITLLPVLLVGLFTHIWFMSLLVSERTTLSSSSCAEPFHQIVRQPAVVALFIVCFLMQASHGPYYTFYSIYLEEHGYTRKVIGQLWAVGVLAEVGMFLVMHRLLEHFNLRDLLIVSLSLTGFRWLLVGYYVQWPSLLLCAQLLHAVSFGMYHGVAMQFIRRYFVDRHQGQAQALYSSLSFGAGGAIGSLMSGYVWEGAGAQVAYSLAALLCGGAIGISWYWIIPPKIYA
jgi:PPP family 3-phenylpropionic acid transporter